MGILKRVVVFFLVIVAGRIVSQRFNVAFGRKECFSFIEILVSFMFPQVRRGSRQGAQIDRPAGQALETSFSFVLTPILANKPSCFAFFDIGLYKIGTLLNSMIWIFKNIFAFLIFGE